MTEELEFSFQEGCDISLFQIRPVLQSPEPHLVYTGALSVGIKWPGCIPNGWLPSVAKVHVWICASTPPYVPWCRCLITSITYNLGS
jgi:hypothetical protein